MEYGKMHTDGSRSGGQKPEPKLTAELAEEIWHISNRPKNEFFAELRERGMIAPEPEPWLPCAHCGGEPDPKGWLSFNGAGPECKSCGVSAPDQATWNARTYRPLPLGRLKYLMGQAIENGSFSGDDAARLHAALTEARP